MERERERDIISIAAASAIPISHNAILYHTANCMLFYRVFWRKWEKNSTFCLMDKIKFQLKSYQALLLAWFLPSNFEIT